jgi:hypothetical protein
MNRFHVKRWRGMELTPAQVVSLANSMRTMKQILNALKLSKTDRNTIILREARYTALELLGKRVSRPRLRLTEPKRRRRSSPA